MRVLGWLLAALAAGALILSLTGSQIRWRRAAPALAADCCDGKCVSPSYCSSRCKCEAGAATQDASCMPPEPHTGLYQADWVNPSRPRAFERR